MSVRINVGNIDGKQPKVEDVKTIGQVALSNQDPIFRPVASFLVSLLGFASLAEIYNSSEKAKPWASDDYILLDASAAGLRLQILGLPIAVGIVRNQWPTSIAINFEPQANPYDGSSTLGEISPYIASAMQGMFTAFFEDNRSSVEAKHGKQPLDWPAVWNFGRVIRNALSHGGDLDIRSPTSVTWKTLTYNQADHGKTVILTDLWPGDIIVLMKEMQDALP